MNAKWWSSLQGKLLKSRILVLRAELWAVMCPAPVMFCMETMARKRMMKRKKRLLARRVVVCWGEDGVVWISIIHTHCCLGGHLDRPVSRTGHGGRWKSNILCCVRDSSCRSRVKAWGQVWGWGGSGGGGEGVWMLLAVRGEGKGDGNSGFD